MPTTQTGKSARLHRELAMNAPPKGRLFFGLLSLGGKLSLVNLNFWLIALLLQRGGAASFLAEPLREYILLAFIFLMLFFSLPFATCLLLPTVGTPPIPNLFEVVRDVLLLVLNSFVWGYGLAWCIERAAKYFRKQPRAD